MENPKKLINDSIKSVESLLDQSQVLAQIAHRIAVSVKEGGTIYLFGNGGSAADAQHIAAELVGRFEMDRKPVPAVALSTDTSVLTSLSNDYGFETVYERQVEAHVRRGDVAIGITTSGSSPNVMLALHRAKALGAVTVLLTGARWERGNEKEEAVQIDEVIVAGSENTARIQEAHIVAGHIVCRLVEEELFTKDGELDA